MSPPTEAAISSAAPVTFRGDLEPGANSARLHKERVNALPPLPDKAQVHPDLGTTNSTTAGYETTPPPSAETGSIPEPTTAGYDAGAPAPAAEAAESARPQESTASERLDESRPAPLQAAEEKEHAGSGESDDAFFGQSPRLEETRASSPISPPSVRTQNDSPKKEKDSDLTVLKNLLSMQGRDVEGKNVIQFVEGAGLLMDDPRVKKDMERISGWDVLTDEQASSVLNNNLIRKALVGGFAIQDFPSFKAIFKDVFDSAAGNTAGAVADYIPKLANQNPNHWGASVCSTDGQRFSIGDVDVPFSAQSSSKPLTYCMALETKGEFFVHQHVGKEPSGRNFNARNLMEQGEGKGKIPHNPCINAGAIMTASLVKMDENEWDRFNYMMFMWEKMCGDTKPSFQYDTFCGERATASRNFCLAYMMQEEKAFPRNTDLQKTLEAYFSWCSIEVNCRSMAVLAGTLANGGVCPITSERIFTHQTVTHCLSIMMSCGMYDFSGQFAFEVGIPAKSGVSGVVFCVVPGVGGFATFSPRLDSLGNSVRGIDFFRRLSRRLPYHIFGRLKGLELGTKEELSRQPSIGTGDGSPTSPVVNRMVSGPLISAPGSNISVHELQNTTCDATTGEIVLAADEDEAITSLLWSAARGDTQRIRQLTMRGMDVNKADYDKRTALHVAASEGRDSSVRLLLELKADIMALDLKGNTPLDDATREHQNAAKRTLQRAHCAQGMKTPSSRKKTKGSCWYDMSSCLRYFADMIVHDEKDKGVELVSRTVLIETLGEYGINAEEDPRLSFMDGLPESLNDTELKEIAERLPLLPRALKGELAIPNFSAFCDKLEELFHTMCVEGENQGYANGDETLDVLTVDGQVLHLGRTMQKIPLDDISSVVVFAVAVEVLDAKDIDALVGHEPSGDHNDSRNVNADGLPYNPFMWNGMLALLALLEEQIEDVWEAICLTWQRLTGQETIETDDEWRKKDMKKHEHPANALIHTLIARGTLPKSTEHEVIVDYFFRLRSASTPTYQLSRLASILANGGIDVFAGERVLEISTVKDMLTLMFTTGCSAMSGEFSFRIGVPVKSSGVGIVILVVPSLFGMCIFGETVNDHKVSKAGLKFSFSIGDEFNVHALGGSCTKSAKLDPALYHFQTDMELCSNLLWASQEGDLSTLIYLRNLGFNINYADYDHRTAVHVAAANGKIRALKYLHKCGAEINEKDRWGQTALNDAEENGHTEVVNCLRRWLKSSANSPDVADSCIESSTGGRNDNIGAQKSDRSGAPVLAKIGKIKKGKSMREIIESEDDGDESVEPSEASGSSRGSLGGFSSKRGSLSSLMSN